MASIRVGIIGVGNCFAGLYQGIEYYRKNPTNVPIGVAHESIGGFSWKDLEFVSAFDVGANKVGRPLHEATYQYPNMVNWLPAMPESKCVVRESPILDGVGLFVQNRIKPVKGRQTSILRKEALKELEDTKTEILVNYMPVGSQRATEFWADVALEAGCAFVNCIPVFIASHPDWEAKFRDKVVPVVGDDVKGLVGATVVHRTLARLCDERGAKINRTYQINVGGNTDFLNMKEQERLTSKRISKTESVQSQLRERLPEDDIYVGPSDFIPFLGNTKLMYMRIEGAMWGDRPYSLEVRLEVDDKANSAGIVVDAIRCAKLAMDRKEGGALLGPSAYLMKHPPKQFSDFEAKILFEKFARVES